MGWNNHDKFNEMYKELIKFDMFDANNQELKIEDFRKSGEVDNISSEDYNDVKDYLKLRCIPHHKSEIDDPRNLKQINNMLRRIAIDQWEAIRHILLSSIKDLNLKKAGLKDFICSEILCLII